MEKANRIKSKYLNRISSGKKLDCLQNYYAFLFIAMALAGTTIFMSGCDGVMPNSGDQGACRSSEDH